jgi:hypothetical protein
MTLIDKVKKELSYRKDINNLKEMLRLYNKCTNLIGGYHSDMVTEINSQIEHCEECIKNIKNT